MKTVYKLRDDKNYITEVQKASLSSKPFGLKMTHGLYGSDIWWQNIEEGKIPLIRYAGTIRKLFLSGMDYEPCFEMIMPNGETFEYGCEAMKKSDRKLYQVGNKVEITFLYQSLKTPIKTPNGFDYEARSIIEIKIEESLSKS